MYRHTPAYRWFLPIGFVAIAFLLNACAERDPIESTADSQPQLAQGGGTQCSWIDPLLGVQVFDAPCIEVTVDVAAQGKDFPAAGSVVEIYNGGFGRRERR
jgi:hypothetical protein